VAGLRSLEGIPLPDITFARKDPQTYVILVSRAGPEGVLLGTRTFKPPGTEYATATDLWEAGFAQIDVAVAALAQLSDDQRGEVLRRHVGRADPERRDEANRIAGALLESARRVARDTEGDASAHNL
jgi:hypothetical protein